MKRYRRVLWDYVEIIIIPSLSVILPWSVAFKLFRWIARNPIMYRENIEVIFDQAQRRGLVKIDKKDWISAHKLSRIIDYADVFLCMTRGQKFIDKYIKFNAKQFLDSGVVFTAHYGTGLWFYRARALAGQSIYIVANKPVKGFKAPELICILRQWVLKNFCKTTVIYSKDIMKLKEFLRSNNSLLVVAPDIPYSPEVDNFWVDSDLGQFNVVASFFKLAVKYNLKTASMISDDMGLVRLTNYVYLNGEYARDKAEGYTKRLVGALYDKSYLWCCLIVAPEVIRTKKQVDDEKL